MADHNHRTVEIPYGIFEDVLGLHIEMIGRFVENKKIDGL